MGFALMVSLELSSTSGGTCSGSAWVLLPRMLQGLSLCTAVPILLLHRGAGLVQAAQEPCWCRMLQPRQSFTAALALPHLVLAEPKV